MNTSGIMVGLVAGACALGGAACAQEPGAGQVEKAAQDDKAAVARISMKAVADVEAVEAGGVFTVALVCRVERGWHTYWPGLNDTGAPATITLTLPEGWTADAPRWPAPVRHVSPGDLLDHALEGEFTVLYDVRVPAGAKAGSETVKASAEWLVCKSVCVMQECEATAAVRVGGERKASEEGAKVVAAGRARLPETELPTGLSLRVVVGGLRVKWDGARKVVFCPASGGIEYKDILNDGEAKGDSLEVGLVTQSPATGEQPRVSGVVIGTLADGVVRAVEVSVPVGGGSEGK